MVSDLKQIRTWTTYQMIDRQAEIVLKYQGSDVVEDVDIDEAIILMLETLSAVMRENGEDVSPLGVFLKSYGLVEDPGPEVPFWHALRNRFLDDLDQIEKFKEAASPEAKSKLIVRGLI